MKKSLNINLAGIVFHIDEDAYHLLTKYLDSLQRHYAQTEEGKEIITDIEARIAEIFQEQLSKYYTVVSIVEVERAIELIGRPEDFVDIEEETVTNDEYTEPNFTENATRPKNRKLYRDPDGRYIAGVAAGIAHFLGVQPIFVRAAFIILQFFYGLGLFTYIVLWVFVKEALTSSQKHEMRGEQVNLSNIEKTIRDEFENVKENVKKGFESVHFESYAHRAGDTLRRVIEGFSVFVRAIFRFIGIIIGAAFAIGGTVAFAAIITTLVFPNLPFAPSFDGGEMLQRVIELFMPAQSMILATLGLFLLIGIPVIGIVYSGIKLVFRLKTRDKPAVLTAFVLWMVGVGIVVSLAIRTGQHYSNFANVDETVVLQNVELDTLNLTLKGLEFSEDLDYGSIEMGALRVLEKDGRILGIPKFDIKKSYDGELKLEMERMSHGFDKKNAGKNAEKIDYKWIAKGKELRFDHYFLLNGADRWLNQSMKLTLKLPVGRVVHLDESMVKIIYDIKNLQNMWDGHMGNKHWVMTDKGLSLLNPEKHDEHMVWPATVHDEVKHEMKQVEEELKRANKEIKRAIEDGIREANDEIERTDKAVTKENEKILQELEEELDRKKSN